METTKQEGHTKELKRLHDNHEVFTAAMGSLLLAPIDLSKPGLRILDSATADGTWLRDLQSSTPNSTHHTYIGTDIVPELFSSTLPANLTLQTHDFMKPWPSEWQNSFDLVHQRLGLAGSGTFPMPTVIANLTTLLKPSGWIELVELDLEAPSGAGPALADFLRLLRELFTLGGMGGNFALKLRPWLEDAGLDNVEEHFVETPTGAKNKDPDLAVKSTNGVVGAVGPLIAAAKAAPTSFTDEQLGSLEARLRDELETVGGVTRMVVVWGQKPAR